MLPISNRKKSKTRAFSLVEILVTLAVIAVISGIAIPVLTNTFYSSQENAARRNAQALAGVASSAAAAGSTAIEEAADKEEAVDLLSAGIKGAGQFANNVFMVTLKRAERERTLQYLEFSDGTLAFDPIDE